jgi:predicted metal-binding protein
VEGRLVLACRKCQKKLKGEKGMRTLSKLKKTVKRHNKEHPFQILHVINVPCMDLCPKGGVTVCNPTKIPNRLSIVREKKDIEALLG